MKYTRIETILFSGKRNLSWKDVEEYLSRYTGKSYIILETKDKIQLGSRFAAEY